MTWGDYEMGGCCDHVRSQLKDVLHIIGCREGSGGLKKYRAFAFYKGYPQLILLHCRGIEVSLLS